MIHTGKHHIQGQGVSTSRIPYSSILMASFDKPLCCQVGRLRPNFVARCWPDGDLKFTGEGIPDCAADAVNPGEGRKSFPSGADLENPHERQDTCASLHATSIRIGDDGVDCVRAMVNRFLGYDIIIPLWSSWCSSCLSVQAYHTPWLWCYHSHRHQLTGSLRLDITRLYV